jgi:hypothetical protein
MRLDFLHGFGGARRVTAHIGYRRTEAHLHHMDDLGSLTRIVMPQEWFEPFLRSHRGFTLI